MRNNKRKIIYSLAGLTVLTVVLMLTLNWITADPKRGQTLIPPAPQSASPDSRPLLPAPGKKDGQQPELPSVSKDKPAPAVTKIEALKKSEDLEMDLVDESLREYILSLYFTFRDSKDKDDFLDNVNTQLLLDFPPETAKKIMKIYEAYLDCELKLQEQLITYGQPETEDDMLFIANDIYEFRKSQMGEELAEKLFGREHDLTVYKILNRKIYDDNSLYGAEKEMQLRLLAAEIFGEEADENLYDKTGESLFQEKMMLYQKDFQEMSEDEKKAKIREFREEYLSPDEIEKIEAAESEVESARKRDADYFKKKTDILNDPELRDHDKQQKIRELQDTVYGDMAEEIRRGEEFARQHNEHMQKTIEDRVEP